HVFRQPRLAIDAICDRVLADALMAANLDGVRIRDAAEI
ncbi:imm11 family protein, partial [Xanthomonas euvesicatoria]